MVAYNKMGITDFNLNNSLYLLKSDLNKYFFDNLASGISNKNKQNLWKTTTKLNVLS